MINDPKSRFPEVWLSLAVSHSFNEPIWDIADKGILRKLSSASYSANFPLLISGGCSKLSHIISHPNRSYSISLNVKWYADTYSQTHTQAPTFTQCLHKPTFFYSVSYRCIFHMWLKLFRIHYLCKMRNTASFAPFSAVMLLSLTSCWYIFCGGILRDIPGRTELLQSQACFRSHRVANQAHSSGSHSNRVAEAHWVKTPLTLTWQPSLMFAQWGSKINNSDGKIDR